MIFYGHMQGCFFECRMLYVMDLQQLSVALILCGDAGVDDCYGFGNGHDNNKRSRDNLFPALGD